MRYISSVQFSRSVVSDSLRPHEPQHARPSCPSPTPRVHSNSRPSSRWCHPALSSSVVPFSSCPQSLPASESFPMSQLFAWGGQSTIYMAQISYISVVPNLQILLTKGITSNFKNICFLRSVRHLRLIVGFTWILVSYSVLLTCINWLLSKRCTQAVQLFLIITHPENVCFFLFLYHMS